ncbi:hypothetical protein [Sutcliffiella halmapala]|uniref:hypothetical protein n=1 Tax=Sutcliffiella halmapala TaxID=79882 RepID=UPI00099541D0|nr:hypothetical protein [Sutcliffiella halmapala]
MEFIQLLSAELKDQSYLFLKLEAFVSVLDIEGHEKCVMQYQMGQQFFTVSGNEIEKKADRKIVEFSILLKKNSGIAATGLRFSFLTPSNKYETEEFHIGGERGNILLKYASIKHYQIYVHSNTLSGLVLVAPSNKGKAVRFVIFNDTREIVKEAIFKENLPYSDIEVWEYTVEKASHLNGEWSFFVELHEEGRQEMDDFFGEYYKVRY